MLFWIALCFLEGFFVAWFTIGWIRENRQKNSLGQRLAQIASPQPQRPQQPQSQQIRPQTQQTPLKERNWPTGVKVAVILILVSFFFISLVGTNAIFDEGHNNQQKSDQKAAGAQQPDKSAKEVGEKTAISDEKKKEQEKKKQEEEQHRKRVLAGVIILLAVLGILAISAYNSCEAGKKWYQQKFWWHPIAITAYALIASHLLIFFLLPGLWNLLWSDRIFIWSLNIGLLVYVALKSKNGEDKKPLPATQKAALVFGVILVIGLLAQMARNPYWKGLDWGWGTGTGSGGFNKPNRTQTGNSYKNVPVEIAKKVVCECESGCKQFETDKDGKILVGADGKQIPLKNKGIPEKGIKPSSAFGKYQFIEAHREPAKKQGFDLNTEEGQEKYFEYLYAKEGLIPWDHDKEYGGGSACWEPKLAAEGYGGVRLPMLLASFDVPTDKWSKEVTNPFIDNSKVCWSREDRTKGGTCEVMFDKDPKKIFSITGSHMELAPPMTLQFKCTESTVMKVFVAEKN